MIKGIMNFFGNLLRPKLLDEKAFTKYYLMMLSKRYPKVDFRIDSELTVKGVEEDGNEVSHFLNNVFNEYINAPEYLNEIIDTYLKGASSIYMESEPLNIDRIVPIIKPINHFENLEQLKEKQKDFEVPNQVWEPYNEKLIIVYAEDKEASVNYFTEEDFSELNIDRTELRQIALNNLLRDGVSDIELRGQKGTFMIIAGGTYEASLILYDEIWNNGHLDVDGDILITVPSRDLVFITGTENYLEIKQLKEFAAEQFANSSYTVSPYFFVWNGRQFVEKEV